MRTKKRWVEVMQREESDFSTAALNERSIEMNVEVTVAIVS